MIPTIEQVREHAENYPILGGSLWRGNKGSHPPEFLIIGLDEDSDIRCRYPSEDSDWWYPSLIPPWEADERWTPCDQAGNPLPLLERIAWLEQERDDLARALRARFREVIVTSQSQRSPFDGRRTRPMPTVMTGVTDDCEEVSVIDDDGPSALPRRACDVCGGPTYRCGGRLGHEGLV